MTFDIDAFDALVATPYAIYLAAKDQDGDPREGSSLLMAGRVVMHYGVRVRQAFYEPLGTYDTILRGLEGAEYLACGGAPSWMTDHFSIAFQFFNSAHSATKGVLTLPAPGERSLGHHAVAVVGWDDGGESLVFRNSWGRGWGDRGYGRISRDYLNRYWHEGWLSRNARYGPSWWSIRRLLDARSAVEYFQA